MQVDFNEAMMRAEALLFIVMRCRAKRGRCSRIACCARLWEDVMRINSYKLSAIDGSMGAYAPHRAFHVVVKGFCSAASRPSLIWNT